ncbi:TPA: hypothetical protein ACMFQN_005270 [Pseudomonas aeruginosa]|uniref:hypothetical protein n=1 Tax=Pseudomonas aeruginosa TaxID=287 RepID=UPI002455C83F|nr:hypothetical protein [Pseudomonas aeruginosa]MDH4704166.1 hypothetical protein [Pseudomonas aeruginosa]
MNIKALEKLMKAEGFNTGHMAINHTQDGIKQAAVALENAVKALADMEAKIKAGEQFGKPTQILVGSLFMAEEAVARALLGLLGSADALRMVDEIRFGAKEPGPGEVWQAVRGVLTMTMRNTVQHTAPGLAE